MSGICVSNTYFMFILFFWTNPRCSLNVPFICSAAIPAQPINHNTVAVTDALAFLHKDVVQKPSIFTILYYLLFWPTVSFCQNHKRVL